MSHNKIKIGDATPNATGEISVDLGDLADVSVSNLSASQTLTYNGTAWENTNNPTATASYIWIGGDYSEPYSNSPESSSNLSTSSYLYVYSNNTIINTISGATVTTSNNWVQSITLPAGNYIVKAQFMVEFSSSGYLAYRIERDTNPKRLSNDGVVGVSRGVTHGPSNSTAEGYIELTSATTIRLRVRGLSGVDSVNNQGTTPSKYGFWYIEEV